MGKPVQKVKKSLKGFNGLMPLKIIASLILICGMSEGILAQTVNFSSPQGYGENVTGGSGGDIILVNNQTELKDALTASGKKVVIVESSFEVNRLSLLIVDKTLLGLPGTKLYNFDLTQNGSGCLTIKTGSNNIIIRNLIFEGPGAYDTDGRDHITNQGTNVWVDHCEFQDGIDGNFDNKGVADDITVTWCKFTYLKPAIPGGPGGSPDHRFSNLVGSNVSDYPADGRYSITWQYNWWAEGVKARMVRARNAQLHMVNNYWSTQDGARAIGLEDGDQGTELYLEGGVFETNSSCDNLYTGFGGSPDVTVVDCIGSGLSNNSSSVSQPSYNYEVTPTADVADAVRNHAGATLIVDVNGNVTASSSGGGVLIKRGSGSKNQTLSLGDAIDNFYFEWSNASTVNVTGVPTGIMVDIDNVAQEVSFSGTPTQTGTFPYTVTTSDGADSENGTITVNGTQSGITLQAEDGELANSAVVESSNSGYLASGYVNFPADDGLVRFLNVDGGDGGNTTMTFRYANGSSNDRTGSLKINGVNQDLTMENTGSWTNWVTKQVVVDLNAGATNTIIFRATGNDFGNLDQITIDTNAGSGGGVGFSAKINFQTVGFNTPSGYLGDEGDAYGNRGNGYSYGWVGGDVTAQRDRGTPSDDRYATLNHLQKQSDKTWEIEVPNGTYDIFLVCGDGSNTDQTNNIDIEGQVYNDPDGEDNFDAFTISGIVVTDSKLTIEPANGADNAKICFIDIDESGSTARFRQENSELSVEVKNNWAVYPNPIHGAATIQFALETPSPVSIKLLTISGAFVDEITNRHYDKGVNQVRLDANNLRSGIYLLSIETLIDTQQLKIIIE